jgi:tagatose 6-phosphate kinase
MIATVTLNPTTDIIARVETLFPGKILRSENIDSYPAGKGVNTARALAALGAEVTAAGFTGKTDAAKMSAFLKKQKINPDFIPVPGSNRLCLLIAGNKEETVINSESNLTISAKQRASFLKKLKTLSVKTRVFVFSGSLPLCLPAGFYRDCIHAVKNNSTVILDTSSKYLREGIKSGPDILKVNIHELESAFGVKFKAVVGTAFRAVRNDLKNFVCLLSKKHYIKTIIITLGERGSVLFNNGLFHFIRPIKIKKRVSPVGCGDAYSAGLAYGIEKKINTLDCCRLGAACATANLKHKGACFISKKDVLNLLPPGFPV